MATFTTHFCGKEISAYGRENGFVDYRCFASAFDSVLNNSLMGELINNGYDFELESGIIDNSEEIEELTDRIDEIESGQDFEETEEGNLVAFFVDEDGERLDEESTAALLQELEELKEKRQELEDEQEESESCEVFQYYIVSDGGAELIMDYNVGYLWYCESLDLYIWGVTHYGTAWDYVLTSIPCEKSEA